MSALPRVSIEVPAAAANVAAPAPTPEVEGRDVDAPNKREPSDFDDSYADDTRPSAKCTFGNPGGGEGNPDADEVNPDIGGPYPHAPAGDPDAASVDPGAGKRNPESRSADGGVGASAMHPPHVVRPVQLIEPSGWTEAQLGTQAQFAVSGDIQSVTFKLATTTKERKAAEQKPRNSSTPQVKPDPAKEPEARPGEGGEAHPEPRKPRTEFSVPECLQAQFRATANQGAMPAESQHKRSPK
jgi:hypothetical protein